MAPAIKLVTAMIVCLIRSRRGAEIIKAALVRQRRTPPRHQLHIPASIGNLEDDS